MLLHTVLKISYLSDEILRDAEDRMDISMRCAAPMPLTFARRVKERKKER